MSSFLDACGATGPLHWTVERRDSAQVERLTFDLPFLVIGRNPGSDLTLSHPDVSDRHAYLQLVAGRLFAVDLGSRLGTHLDGRCQRSGWVERGGMIRIGPYRLRLVSGDREPRNDDDDRALGGSRGPGLTLELVHRSLRSSSCSLADDLILVGSSAACQARLLDPNVSDVHCALLRTPNGYWMVDLCGRGGVAIHGTETRFGPVAEGDELRIGNSLVRLTSPRLAEAANPETRPYDALSLPSPVPAAIAAADLRPLLSGLTTETAESFLIPLANQLSMMQQHMFDRIQQAERERFEALAAFQSEQFSALREELEQLRELRQEIDQMRDELRTGGRPPAGQGPDHSTRSSGNRPRLGSASTPMARDGAEALAPAPEPPGMLRIRIGEAS